MTTRPINCAAREKVANQITGTVSGSWFQQSLVDGEHMMPVSDALFSVRRGVTLQAECAIQYTGSLALVFCSTRRTPTSVPLQTSRTTPPLSLLDQDAAPSHIPV